MMHADFAKLSERIKVLEERGIYVPIKDTKKFD